MGIVVLVISSGAGEADGLFSVGKVPEEVVVKELGAIVGVETK